jgi:uncharacterized protein YjbI with pentapeptide repeats
MTPEELEAAIRAGRSFAGVRLTRSNLSGRAMHGAKLAGAKINRTILRGADLSGADLTGADISVCLLNGANLSGASLKDATFLMTDMPGVNLRGANLAGAKLSQIDMAGADLSGADLAGATLVGADLSNAKLTGANLTGARLDLARLHGADLSGATIERASFCKADLTHASLRDTAIHESAFIGATLSGADLSTAALDKVVLVKADLRSATVMITGMPALNMGSIIAKTEGDEPGTAHPTIMGVGTFVMGNPVVMVAELPGINLTCPATGNNMNVTSGLQAVPPGPLGLRSGSAELLMDALAQVEALIDDYGAAARELIDTRMLLLDDLSEEVTDVLSLIGGDPILRGGLPDVTQLLEGLRARAEIKRRYLASLLNTLSSAEVVVYFLDPPEEPTWRRDAPSGMGESPLFPAGMSPEAMLGVIDPARREADVMGHLKRLYAEWRSAIKRDPRLPTFFLWLEKA